MYCPNCKEEFDGKFCPECGTKLTEKPVASGAALNLSGDANAISGGIHMADSHNVHNEDRSVHNITNTTSTVNNITQAQKTEMELLQERKAIYLTECKRAYEDNVLEQSEIVLLEECRIKLGLDKTTADAILNSVRIMSERNARKSDLNPLARTKLKILTDKLQKNEVKALMDQIDSLEPLVRRFDHDELSRKYYLVLAALKPEKCIEQKEQTQTDTYWEAFWSYLAYIKAGRLIDAEETLASLDHFSSYPEDNMTILAAAGALMMGHADEAKEYLDAAMGEYTPALQRFVDSLYLLLNPDIAKDMGADGNTCAFYLVNFFGQKDPKAKVEEEVELKRQEEEKICRAEEEGRRRNEAELQKNAQAQQDNTSQSFSVVLASVGLSKKIQVALAIQKALVISLEEAKDLVDGTPSTLEEGLSKDEAERMKHSIEAAGAYVRIVGREESKKIEEQQRKEEEARKKAVEEQRRKEAEALSPQRWETVDVILEDVGGAKLQVVKALKESLDLGLKEAKDLADWAPSTLKEGISYNEAENIKKEIEAAGAYVRIVGREESKKTDITDEQHKKEAEALSSQRWETVDVILEKVGGAKLQVVKTLKESLGLGLKEAKDLADGAPSTLKEGISYSEAENIKKEIEEAGAYVRIVGEFAEQKRREEEEQKRREDEARKEAEEIWRQKKYAKEQKKADAYRKAKEEEEKKDQEQIIKNLIANMVLVEGGSFTMGATSEQGSEVYKDEKPTHCVTLTPYKIGRYEVTLEEWLYVMGNNPTGHKGYQRPVGNVSWNDCQLFIRKLNKMTGRKFCLPSEAQWEFAARGGNKSRGFRYAGSNNLDEVAWYWKNSGDKLLDGEWNEEKVKNNHCRCHVVGKKAPNELGLYDMCGNVWEWCNDWYGSYEDNDQINPKGPSSGTERVQRGGCRYVKNPARISYRSSGEPNDRFSNVGFRLALRLSQEELTQL